MSSDEDVQDRKKASISKTPTVISNSDKDSSCNIKPKSLSGNQCKESMYQKSTTMNDLGKELLPNKKSKQNKKVAHNKFSDEESTKDCNQRKQTSNPDDDQNSLIFDDEASGELKETATICSPSTILDIDTNLSSNRSKLSFRKISMEVASSLPLENDSDESEEEEKVEKEPKVGTSFSSSYSHPVQESDPVISSMTKEQIEEHISCCLQLNTENKINTKNAFALKLIDCMTLQMKSAKDESNFAAVACQLDAGAKIYSNRVDAVHQQVMKLAESCLFAEKKGKNKKDKDIENEDDDNNETGGDKSEKARRKKAKKKILAAPEQITRKLKGKNPRDNYVQLEARPGGILDKARRDPKDLSLTLEKHVPFWHEGPGTSVGGFVKIPKIELKSRKIIPDLDMASLLTYLPKPDSQSSQPSTSADCEIPQPSSPPVSPIEDSPYSPENNFDEMENDIKLSEDVSEGPANEATNEVHIISLAESRMSEQMASKPSRLAVMKALFHMEGESEYDYLKMDSKHYWAGPSYWKRPQGVSAAAYKKKTIRKKKEPIEIDYSNELDMKPTKSNQPSNVAPLKRTTRLSKRTMANWSKKKVTYPPDIHFEPQTLYQLFSIETRVLLTNDEPDSEDPTKEEDCDEPNDDIQDGDDFADNPADSSGEDNPLPLSEIKFQQETSPAVLHTENENPPELNPDAIEEDVVGASNPIPATSDDVYEGDNLVPMVKMVQVEPIRCVAKPNRVDFQHLKRVMLDVIQEHIEDKENQNLEVASGGTRSGTVAFKDVLHVLFNSNRLNQPTQEDLSVAMAFLCLLTLTNEHSFSLIQPENSATEDILISYEMDENSPNRQSSSLLN